MYGSRTRVKVVKNKVAPPFREALFDIIYGQGISREGELLDMGVDAGVVDKSGAWYAFGSERLGQGKENVRAFLQENTEIRQAMEDKLLEHLGHTLKGTDATKEATPTPTSTEDPADKASDTE